VEYYQKSQQGQAFERLENDLARANLELANSRATVDNMADEQHNLLKKLEKLQTVIAKLKKQPCMTCIHVDTMRSRLAQLEEQVSAAIVPGVGELLALEFEEEQGSVKDVQSFVSNAPSHPYDMYFTSKYGSKLARDLICDADR